MKHLPVLAFALTLIGSSVLAQSLPDAVLIKRMTANRGKFAEWDHGVNLREKVVSSGQDVTANPIVKETSTICDGCPAVAATADPAIKRAARESDLVVTGHVVRNISALTENESFVFTDSEFVLDSVWRKSSIVTSTDSSVGSEITVAWPGGEVKVEGHKISSFPTNRTPLLVGHQYLLFLKYLPDSQSYMSTSLDGFDIGSPKVLPLRKTLVSPAHDLLNDKLAFLQAVRSATIAAHEGDLK